jgi:hypothetical protein
VVSSVQIFRQNVARMTHLSYECHTLDPSHDLLFDNPNNTVHSVLKLNATVTAWLPAGTAAII